jgi:hypothetical protein
MKNGHLSVLLFIIVVAVLMISGCSSNNNESPTPTIQPCPTPMATPLPTVNPTAVPSTTPAASGTPVPVDVANSTNASVTPTVQPVISPTPTPQASASPTPTAQPTPTPTPVPTQDNPGLTTVGQLYNTGGLHSYEYRFTSITNGNTYVIPAQVAYSDDTYEGIAAEHVSMICDTPNAGSAAKIHSDTYFSKANNSALGGHWKLVSEGEVIMEENMSASRVEEGKADMDVAKKGELYGSSPLKYEGMETVTIDGRAYDCMKYTFNAEGVTHTMWYTREAPIPVKFWWIHDGFNDTYELLDWR